MWGQDSQCFAPSNLAVFVLWGTVFPKTAVGLLRLNLDVFGVKATHVMVSHFHQKLCVSSLKYWGFFFFFPHLPL